MSPRVVLIGMPGAGKSSVGRRLAQRLDVPFADSDQLIAEHENLPVAQALTELGEDAFRELEAKLVARALEEFNGVLSLGGGAAMHPQTRELLVGHRVVLIEATDAVLSERVSNSHQVRPLLAADVPGGIARLRRARGDIYRELATDVVISRQGPIMDVVDGVAEALTSTVHSIDVLGANPYQVHVGRNLRSQLLAQAARYANVLLVVAPDVTDYVATLQADLECAGTSVATLVLPRGEEAKTPQTLANAWDFAGQAGIGRDGLVLCVGGGATTDVGGFIAATWLRGVDVIQVPTTLLGMVDAAIGGKTGINTSLGKNLVGSFYPPRAVYCDVETLRTLPEVDLVAGLGEVVKCGFIADRKILELIAQDGRSVLDPSSATLVQLIERAVSVKARVVSEDLHEHGVREILNYGHTLAHAIERHENYQRRHGEAVAIGCVFAAALAEEAGIAEQGFTQLHRDAFASLGLPVSYSGVDFGQLRYHMDSDKKTRRHELRFVVLNDIGHYQILRRPDEQLLRRAAAHIGL